MLRALTHALALAILGSAVDALNATYPKRRLIDHSVLLTLEFVPAASARLHFHTVASRCSTFAPERLIGIF